MRNTKQRKLVLDIINNSYSHPTAEDVYMKCKKVVPNISLGTVYRNLNLLVELNQIIRLRFDNDVDRFDKCLDHAHFHCAKCSKIEDIYESIDIANLIGNNKVIDCKIILEGICSDCLKKEE